MYLAARDEERAKAAIERLHAEGLGPGNGEVVWLRLDLCAPREVKKSAEEEEDSQVSQDSERL